MANTQQRTARDLSAIQARIRKRAARDKPEKELSQYVQISKDEWNEEHLLWKPGINIPKGQFLQVNLKTGQHTIGGVKIPDAKESSTIREIESKSGYDIIKDGKTKFIPSSTVEATEYMDEQTLLGVYDKYDKGEERKGLKEGDEERVIGAYEHQDPSAIRFRTLMERYYGKPTEETPDHEKGWLKSLQADVKSPSKSDVFRFGPQYASSGVRDFLGRISFDSGGNYSYKPGKEDLKNAATGQKIISTSIKDAGGIKVATGNIMYWVDDKVKALSDKGDNNRTEEENVKLEEFRAMRSRFLIKADMYGKTTEPIFRLENIDGKMTIVPNPGIPLEYIQEKGYDVAMKNYQRRMDFGLSMLKEWNPGQSKMFTQVTGSGISLESALDAFKMDDED